MNEEEKDFLNFAIQHNFLTSSEAKECILAQQRFLQYDLSKTIWQIALEQKVLTAHQVKKISTFLASRKSISFPGYQIVKKLGEGGMGTVYEAIQTSLERKVALKVISTTYSKDKTYLARMSQEAKTLARLNHPNIVSAIDFGTSRGISYLVMECIDGIALDEEIKRGVIFSENQALDIMLQMASALSHARQHNLIHRDIKPANIMIDHKGTAKLCDLGLVKDVSIDSKDLTLTKDAMGSPIYMSPEQVRGEKNIDIRSDIYSLGATFFHLVTGHPPYKGEALGHIFSQILSEKIPNPKTINPKISFPVNNLIRKMMAKEVGKRHQTPEDLIQNIKRTKKNIQTSKLARFDGKRNEFFKENKRNQKIQILMGGIVGLVTLLSILVGFIFLLDSKSKQKKRPNKKIVLLKPKQEKTKTFHPTIIKNKKKNILKNKEKMVVLAKKLFPRSYKKYLGANIFYFSYSFQKPAQEIQNFWNRNKQPWKESGFFEEKEQLRFLLPHQEILKVFLSPKSQGDFYLILFFEKRPPKIVLWRSCNKYLEIQENGMILKSEELSMDFSSSYPLVINSVKGTLQVGTKEGPLFTQKASPKLINILFVPQMNLLLDKINLVVKITRKNFQKVTQIWKQKTKLSQKPYHALQDGQKNSFLLEENKKLFFIQSKNRREKWKNFSLEFDFSFPKGDSFSLFFPFGEKSLQWNLKRSALTGIFPLSRLLPEEKFYFPLGIHKKKWHHGKITVIEDFLAIGEVDGKRAFSLVPEKKWISTVTKKDISPYFFSKDPLDLKNIRFKKLSN